MNVFEVFSLISGRSQGFLSWIETENDGNHDRAWLTNMVGGNTSRRVPKDSFFQKFRSFSVTHKEYKLYPRLSDRQTSETLMWLKRAFCFQEGKIFEGASHAATRRLASGNFRKLPHKAKRLGALWLLPSLIRFLLAYFIVRQCSQAEWDLLFRGYVYLSNFSSPS